MGKTSFLEVIYFSLFYLQLGKKIYEELIKFNEPNFLNMSLVTENDYDYKIKTSFSKNNISICINERCIKKLSDLLTFFHAFFSYDYRV